MRHVATIQAVTVAVSEDWDAMWTEAVSKAAATSPPSRATRYKVSFCGPPAPGASTVLLAVTTLDD